MLIQLDFFEQDDTKLMRDELARVKEATEKVRKGLFARHNELARMFMELDARLNIIEMFICKKGASHDVHLLSEQFRDTK